MKEEWLMPTAVVPVDSKTTAALVNEVKRLIGVVGSMALKQQRTWVGLTYEEIDILAMEMVKGNKSVNWLCKVLEAKLKEKNT